MLEGQIKFCNSTITILIKAGSITQGITMSQTTSISAKIPKSLKQKIDKYGINVSETVREALNREVERKMRSKALDRIESSKAKPLPRGMIARVVREVREEC